MMKNRAVARFEIKSIDEDAREFSGTASTPETDIQGDRIDPLGAKFSLPLPVLWQHDASKPIGWITKARPSASGLMVEGKIAKIDSPPSLKESLDFAFACVKSGLVRGLSIGFKVLKETPTETGFHITSWLLLEISCVTIAANQSASITAIRSADRAAGSRGASLPSSAQRELLARMGARSDPRVAQARAQRIQRERAEAHQRDCWRHFFPD